MTTSRQDATTLEESTALIAGEHTTTEAARIANYHDRVKRRPVKFKVSKNNPNALVTEADGPEKSLNDPKLKLMESLGTADEGLQLYLLDQVIRTFKGFVSPDSLDNDRLDYYANNAVAILNGIQPRDEIEGMLAVQMIAVHNMAMETLKRAILTGQTFQGEDANVNRATKMLRTFTMQMEALKRYRSGGEQKVTVQHVHVNEGGQAIVGAVSTQGGSSDGKTE